MDKKLNLSKTIYFAFILIIYLLIMNKYFKLSVYLTNDLFTNKIKMEVAYLKLKIKYSNIDSNQMPNKSKYQKNIPFAIPVLMYHGISDEENNKDISLSNFTDQMLTLKKIGYQTITIKEFYNFTKGGVKDFPQKPILITFDDGKKNSYYPADPLFKLLDYNAVIFVITNRLHTNTNNKYYLNESELKYMIKSGRWEIQSHGNDDHNPITINSAGDKGHFLSNKKWIESENRHETDNEYEQRLFEDLQKSKTFLEEITDTSVISYAFPFGDFGQETNYNSDISKIVKKVSSEMFPISFFQFRPEIATGYFKYNYLSSKQEFLFRRILMPPLSNGKWLQANLESGFPKDLPYEYNFSNIYNWVTGISNHSVILNSDKMIIETRPGYDTTTAVLDGGQYWTNYIFKSNIQIIEGEQYSLMVRSLDGYNHIDCVFSKNNIKIKEYSDGSTQILSSTNKNYIFDPFKMNNVSVKVTNKQIGCFVNNKLIIETLINNNNSNHGSVGYKLWGIKEKSVLNIQNIYVESISQ